MALGRGAVQHERCLIAWRRRTDRVGRRRRDPAGRQQSSCVLLRGAEKPEGQRRRPSERRRLCLARTDGATRSNGVTSTHVTASRVGLEGFFINKCNGGKV
jgi:hypothetical protein